MIPPPSATSPPAQIPASGSPVNTETTASTANKQALHRGSFDTIVEIKVGPQKKVFKIYKQLLCEASPYFEAALKGQFKETQEQSIELVEEKVKTFEYFQLWLFSGKVLAANESAKDISSDTLYDLYLFGEIRHIPGLQNAAIDLFIDRQVILRSVPTYLLPRICQDLPEGAPLRRLFVDWLTYNAILTDGNWFSDLDTNKAIYPQEFLIDLAKSLYARAVGDKPNTLAIGDVRSNYHVNAATDSSGREDTGEK